MTITETVFLSTPSARRATPGRRSCWQRRGISIHALREEGDVRQVSMHNARSISIHALREEGDLLRTFPKRTYKKFLSTPSARRATAFAPGSGDFVVISIHALREEGDVIPVTVMGHRKISIHALREEGDEASVRPHASLMISIHALREEGDDGRPGVHQVRYISIHALREEGDRSTGGRSTSPGYFYPRPPRGGRLTRYSLSPR